ncbi:MAG: phosphatase PAP2 family protein [bacterium]
MLPNRNMYSLDLEILYFINVTLSAAWLDGVMIYATNVQHWVPVYCLLLVFLIAKFRMKGLRMVTALLILVGVSDLVTNRVLKEAVARPRPCAVIHDSTSNLSWLRTPDGVRGGFSFPSSHSVNNFAAVIFFIVIFPKNRKLYWLFLPAFIVALSRPYLGLHYPSDMLGGIVIGTAMGYIFAILYKRIETVFTT